MTEKDKLNLGAGKDIRQGYVNHDVVAIEGIDEVHDLNELPWPWPDNRFSEIEAQDVLEHLDNFFPIMEEIHRVLKPKGEIRIKVPYWNSSYFHIDPTHKQSFHEMTFHFMDPNKKLCQTRNYYTKARFHILDETYVLIPFLPYLPIPFLGKVKIKNKIAKRIIGFIGNFISNVILDLEVTLRKV